MALVWYCTLRVLVVPASPWFWVLRWETELYPIYVPGYTYVLVEDGIVVSYVDGFFDSFNNVVTLHAYYRGSLPLMYCGLFWTDGHIWVKMPQDVPWTFSLMSWLTSQSLLQSNLLHMYLACTSNFTPENSTLWFCYYSCSRYQEIPKADNINSIL